MKDSPSFDQFLDAQASEGSLDSSGQFTIGWERAVQKLQQFQAGDADSYLLFLVSAGRAFGARNVSIKETQQQLRVHMHGAYVSLEDVKRGFEAISSGNAESDTLDLAMGLHGGLRGKVEEVTLSCVHPERPCYGWKLTRETETAEPNPESVDEGMIIATFSKGSATVRKAVTLWEWLFGVSSASNLGGYVGMSSACRLVDRRCDRADIPITINNNMVSRQLNLPVAPLAVQVGSLRGVRFHSKRVLKIGEKDWRGALVFQPGPLQLVINAVAYPPLIHPLLSGTVWVHLNRDLSRQRIIEDEAFSHLMTELEEVAKQFAQAERDFQEGG